MKVSNFRALPFVLALGLGVTGLGLGCKAKPSEKACREAINNIRRITEQSANDVGGDPVADVRSCRGNSSKKAVECWRAAKTLEDLARCEQEVSKKGSVPATPDSEPAAKAEPTTP